MSGDAHRVRRLLWRIKLGSPEEAFALRARLTRTVRTEILPEIERVFAELPSGDDLIQIERLGLTIRVADTDSLEQATVDAIRSDLPARLATRGPYEQPDPATFFGGDHTGYLDYPTLQD